MGASGETADKGPRSAASRPPARPRLSHPLSGADLATFLSVLVEGGGVSANRLPQAATALAAIVGRLPLTAVERLVVAAKRKQAAESVAPLFIVGHWRSGTTHLYNLMGRAGYGFVPPVAAGIPWDFLTLGTLFGPLLNRLLPKTRYIDNIPVLPDSPQEDELALANMSPLSFYHALYFPERFERFFDRGLFLDGCSPAQIATWQKRFCHFMEKLAIHHRGRRVVIKNPVYTARVGLLHQMLPEAKFIHIHRNPTDVFFSMRNFYRRLFEEFALQRFEQVDIDEVILTTYPRMMDQLEADRRSLPAGSFVEIGYDALIEDPLDTLSQVYGALDLPDFDTHRGLFQQHLSAVRDYRKNRFEHDPATVALVEAHWQPFYERYGYPLSGSKAGKRRTGTA